MVSKNKKNDMIVGYLFILPAMILLFLFIIWPMGSAISYSFTDYFLLKPGQQEFIGLENYIRLFKDEQLITSFINTCEFVIKVVPLQLFIALSLALIINKHFKGNGFYRVAYFSPAILSLVVVSILWSSLLNPTSGLINEILENFNFAPQPFLTSVEQAMNSIVVISAYSSCGYQMLIFLAGLKNIDQSMYEAATIDGANKVRQFFHITIPGLRAIIIYQLITIVIQAFKLIVQPMVMTGGGPDYSTITILQFIYEEGFRHRYIGYASAVTIVFTIFLIVVSLLIKRILPNETD
ncbi:MAG: sugar ABC transporter permease [Sphaerochaetaceae bacterium]|nr:sugar ABC transporter permease [Sphaerochaetaceae bacterium]MDC7238303.1 sugar ABC transporter permease [Sphaerochaetaceae bacterium]